MIEISIAGEEHLDDLAILFNAYRVFYNQSSDLTRAKEFLANRMKNKESVVFMASYHSHPAGFTQLFPIFSSVQLKPAWLLNDLYVTENYRKKGIAAQLLDAASNWASKQGAPWLMLETGVNNTAAQKLYQQNGWKKIEDFFYRKDL